MNVIDFDYDLKEGFVWIQVTGKYSDDEPYIVQCCVEDNSKKIKMSDCGSNWGLCADANEKAFKHYGENRCMKSLFHYAKQNGFEVY